MITIPNQSSVAKAFLEFDDAGRMKPSAYYERVVDVMEELVKFTLLTRDVAPLPGRPLQRAQGKRRGAVEAGEPALDLSRLRCWTGASPSCATSRNARGLRSFLAETAVLRQAGPMISG